jgi:hyperosmotically inducible protein
VNIQRKAISALLAGALLGLGLTGCASWRAEHGDQAAYERRGPMQTLSDADITAKVKTALIADDMVKARHIDVDTLRGVVQLNGTVGSEAERDRALRIARHVSGVLEVHDNLKTSG